MPEQHMTHYPVRDFETIRIACNHQPCNAVIELPLRRVEAVMVQSKGCCPLCGKPFTDPTVNGGADVVTQIATAVLALSQLPNVTVQFPKVSEE